MTTIVLKPTWKNDIRRITCVLPENSPQTQSLSKEQLKEKLSNEPVQIREAPTHLFELRTFLKWTFKIDAIPDQFIKLTYIDEENDHISIASDEDIRTAYQFALQRDQPLKIFIEKLEFAEAFPPVVMPQNSASENNEGGNNNNNLQYFNPYSSVNQRDKTNYPKGLNHNMYVQQQQQQNLNFIAKSI